MKTKKNQLTKRDESGIHTHGVLNNPATYEPFPPEVVGNTRRLTIGKQSGKAIIDHKIKMTFGRPVNDPQLDAVVQRVREIYEGGRKASLREEEFRNILQDVGLA